MSLIISSLYVSNFVYVISLFFLTVLKHIKYISSYPMTSFYIVFQSRKLNYFADAFSIVAYKLTNPENKLV